MSRPQAVGAQIMQQLVLELGVGSEGDSRLY